MFASDAYQSLQRTASPPVELQRCGVSFESIVVAVESDGLSILLSTPSRKATRDYLQQGEPNAKR
jgi:hypothetical protein